MTILLRVTTETKLAIIIPLVLVVGGMIVAFIWAGHERNKNQ